MAQREGGARPNRDRMDDEKGPPRRRPMFRRKVCRFCADKTLKIDYKDVKDGFSVRYRARENDPKSNYRQLRSSSKIADDCDQKGA